jgi:hypothetical protein
MDNASIVWHIHASEPARIIPSDGRRLLSGNVPNIETVTAKFKTGHATSYET